MKGEDVKMGIEERARHNEFSVTKYLPNIIKELSFKFEDIFSVMNGYCQMGLMDGNSEMQRESLEKILELLKRGNILIQQLVAVSRLSEDYLLFSFKEGFENGQKGNGV